jgi:hypothetical protein
MRSKVLLSLMLAPAAANAQTVMSGAFVSPYFGVTAAGGGDVRYLGALGDEADDDNLFGIEISSLDFVRVSAGLMVAF